MQVRKPTEIFRATCKQELRLLLDAEADAPADTYRRVHVFTPPSPRLHIAIDHPTPNEAGPNRDYAVPPVTLDTTIQFYLQPHQKLFGMVEQGGGFATASILVEYLEGGG